MGPALIARNYAETLLALAHRHGGEPTVDEYAAAIDDVAEILEREPLIRDFLETPRVDLDAKKRAIEASFRGRVPDLFLRFLIVVVEKRRQSLLRSIAEQYHILVDEARGRVRAEVVLAREADESLKEEILTRLRNRLGQDVTADFTVDPSLIGGVVIRVGGEILDGSLLRRLTGLRRRMLESPVPSAAGAARPAS